MLYYTLLWIQAFKSLSIHALQLTGLLTSTYTTLGIYSVVVNCSGALLFRRLQWWVRPYVEVSQ